jgi:NAD(P)-dependent dehydrogenase (short-subunit alcohol dehydrogenase family)
MEAALVTGGTGLIGKHLVERLLARGHRVLLLVRPGAEARRPGVLARLGAAAEASPGELHGVPGDVAEPGMGIDGGLEAHLDGTPLAHVFHLAALYDLAAPEAELVRVNVDGTRHLLAALRTWGFTGCLHHVSSVAVAGDHRGTFRESDVDVGQSHPHPYHRTKLESERLVRQSGLGRVRIYRPGAVVGHSRTGEMDRIDGPYYAFKALRVLRDNVPRWVTLPLTARGRLPLAPVDFVADAIDHIAHRPGLDGGTFHVLDPDPPDVVHALNLLSKAAGGPRFARVRVRGLSRLQRSPMVAGMRALGAVQYLRGEVLADLDVPAGVLQAARFDADFDTTELQAALADSPIRCPRPSDYVPALWDYWLRNLDPGRDPRDAQRRYLEGRRVLITGASSGIGAALAEQCAALGAEVILVARRAQELAQVTERIRDQGGQAAFFTADLTSIEACDAVVEQVLAQHGPVHILVNNAGHSIRRTVAESLDRFHDLERLMQINYFAPARLIRGFLPAMREQRFGHIVNALTAGARVVSPRFGAYTATKAALGQLSSTLGAELAHEGIRVTNAYLPWVRTPMMDATGKYADTPAKTPEEAADWMLQAVAQGRADAISPMARQRFVAHVLAPRLVERLANTALRIYADDPDAHPDFAMDRAVLGRILPGRLV